MPSTRYQSGCQTERIPRDLTASNVAHFPIQVVPLIERAKRDVGATGAAAALVTQLGYARRRARQLGAVACDFARACPVDCENRADAESPSSGRLPTGGPQLTWGSVRSWT